MSTSAPTSAPAHASAPARKRSVDWRDYIIYIGLVLVYGICVLFLHDSGFATVENLLNIFRQTAMIAFMAVAVTFVIAAAEIDLSVGAVAGLASVTAAMGVAAGGPIVGALAGIGTGVLVGLINGSLVAFARIPSFLVTLGMMGIAAGAAMWITGSAPQPILSSGFNAFFGGGSIGPIPSLLIWVVIATVLGATVMHRTAYGRRVLATGGNELAAIYSGVRTRRIIFSVLMASAVAASIAGMLYAGRLESGRYQWGTGDELSVIAAVILGGTSLFGGRGAVVGSVIGALLIGVINNGLVLAGLDTSQQNIVRGVIIILAVALGRKK
ncbi:Inositol transport system permease protein [Micrococcus lylae]|uniref:Inositol transport system permease protein n=1 Tax=Micrococcus lylae TaxID=1273 RepID=A0A1R4JWT9_9MICC|nr:ABC transporter permease [Micrococcus lylae]SJN36448.1 Inositol transport system permease protein [Micrococcus lylae]